MVTTAKILHLVELVMWHRASCILGLICLWSVAPALAQSGQGKGAVAAGGAAAVGQTEIAGEGDDVFAVRGLAVDVTAESAVEARREALREGQRRALGQILRRLTLRTDHLSLPDPDDEVIAQFVAAVAVAKEKTSTVRYLAELTVRFKRNAVRGLLRSAGIRFSETRAKPILVLPVFEKGAALSLFEDSNVWRNAWGGVDLREDSLLPLRLPIGDLKDITTLTADAALAGKPQQLQNIARRYGVENVVVAHAVLGIDLTSGGVPRVQVNLLRFGPGGKSTEVLDYSVNVGNDLEAALDRLALRVVVDQQEQWKRRTQLSFGTDTSLSAQVPLSGLRDWLAVRKRLGAVAMVRSFKLLGISRQDAQVVIDYLGDPDSLAVSLAQRDLNLARVDGFWVLRLAGREGEAKDGAKKTGTGAQ
ncbi:MAG: DUF2066 domain-containing protein [Alphaproteobacteria bacterium]|nr:DUF2066 domain-containing protein [Alphaproteobacteria bacterium]MDP6873649.1 DUF2066 domain-containing protein [Alphaproteobacteria bacterium]